MPAPFFSDIFKLFSYATRQGSWELVKNNDNIEGVGVISPEARWDIRNTSSTNSGTLGIRIQGGDSADFIDLQTIVSRRARYREYEFLEVVPEVYAALNIYADESCLYGSTKIATPFGYISIKELSQQKSPEERFLVYCWDFEKDDYSLGWAYHPRFVKNEKTIKVAFDDGNEHIVTPDHKFLTSNNTWVCAGDLKKGDKLKPFYRVTANEHFTKQKTRQFARIFTFNKGWVHERQFVDEWKTNKDINEYKVLNEISKYVNRGLNKNQIMDLLKCSTEMISDRLHKEGFSYAELKYLAKRYSSERTVVGVFSHSKEDVYDLSVEGHANFATDSIIVHNCQIDESGLVFRVKCSNDEVKREANFLIHRLLGMDDRAWGIQRNLCKNGDHFLEIVIDPRNPKQGIVRVESLPADQMYRIQTIKGKLVEFQQSPEGPDYTSLKFDITKASESELAQSTAIRFHPEQIIHLRLGDDRRAFYPYGVSMLEAARGPAHQLRLMEDSMLVYRFTRAPERRVVYVDVGTLQPNRAEYMLDRLKDQFRKKKVFSQKQGGAQGASSVEERWTPIPPDEDIFLAVRPNSQTRIDTLPGACLALDTEIALLDGRNLSLSKIIEEHNNGKQNWVYSCNPTTGEFAPGKITWAGVTRKNTQVVKVTFDNGKSVICTPDHNFPVQGRGKTQAKDLNVGDSLFPFNTRKAKIKKNTNEYWQVYDNKAKSWKFVHRLVTDFLESKIRNEINSKINKKNNSSNELKMYGKSTLNFPKTIFSYFIHRLSDGITNVESILSEINKNKDLMSDWIDSNQHVKRKNVDLNQGIKRNHISKMLNVYGYKTLTQAKKEAVLYNHTVVNIEYLNENIDTGTITVDGNEELHNYHTFALSSCGVVTYNSNLGEISDVEYFKQKLYMALQFPDNYLTNQDPQSNRLTLSQRDVRFARLIERLQRPQARAMQEVVIRHLKLRGYPPESYMDLEVAMTQPSDWRQINRNEVSEVLYQRAATMKGSRLMSDYDIFVRILGLEKNDAKEIVGRMKAQAYDELKMQAIGANPEAMGLIPMVADQGTQIGANSQGPNPELPPDQENSNKPPEEEGKPEGSEEPSNQPEESPESSKEEPKKNTKALPEPNEEDIKKYDLEISGKTSEEEEEVDLGEILD